MHRIDKESWPRAGHFMKFKSFDHPHFSMCANVDLTNFYPAVKQGGYSLNISIVYVLSRAANAIPEFRHRIRGDQVIEHELVHPSTTILTKDDLFSFCTLEYQEDYNEFANLAQERIAHLLEHPTLEDEPEQDDLLFMTAIPWVSFTSFIHPMHLHPADSVPRLSWGKFFEEGNILKMPLDVQVHHALMDGVHVGRFYEAVQAYLSEPELILQNA